MSKVRVGFVSNSSSSSFICLVCGNEASGWDLCLSEAEMVECENGHTFCNSHLLKKEKEEATTNELDEEIEDTDCDEDYDDIEDDVPTERCPICQFKSLSTEDGLSYLLKKHNLTEKICLEQIKQEFSNYEKFTKYLGEK
jgi:DNA-directed RNA polymerase subunit RPC12/RpoP